VVKITIGMLFVDSGLLGCEEFHPSWTTNPWRWWHILLKCQETLNLQRFCTSQKTRILIYSTGKTSQVTQHLFFLSYGNCNM